MDKPKGGRGHTAPYETKQMRVPAGLEPQIQELITRFRNWVSDAAPGTSGTSSPPRLLDKAEDKLVDKLLEENKSLDKLVNELRKENAKLVDKIKAKELESATVKTNKPVDRLLDVIALLQDALLLKANAGGAIKREIEKAISLLKER